MPDLAQLDKSHAPAAQPDQADGAAAFQRRDIKCLTSLRFFPALGVVFYHAREYFTFLQFKDDVMVFGQAVSFFFALSGFILTLNYFRLSNVADACRFYVARLARVWPAHVFTLIALVTVIPELFKWKGSHLPLFLTNMFMLQSWIPSWRVFFSYNAPGWSNSTELFFYLCFPVLLFLLRKKWYFPLLISSTMLAGMIYLCNSMHLPEWDAVGLSDQGLLYINPMTRIFEFTAGMVTALLWMRTSPKIRIGSIAATVLEAVVLVAVLFISFHSAQWRYQVVGWTGTAAAFWMQNSGFPVLGFATLFYVFASERGWLSRKLLSLPGLVLLGELSFGMYMLHCVLLAHRAVNYPLDTSVSACVLFLTTLLVATHFMFVAIEQPLRKRIIRFGNGVISRKFGGQSNKAKSEPVSGKRSALLSRALIAAEGLLLVFLFYMALPTVRPISSAKAATLASSSAVHDVDFKPYLRCKKATAVANGNKVNVTLVWQALESGVADNSIILEAIDTAGRRVGGITYTQEMRRKELEAGTMWCDQFDLITRGEANRLSVKVIRAKRRVLLPSVPGGDNPENMTIPVSVGKGTGVD